MTRTTQDIYRNREKGRGLALGQGPRAPGSSSKWFLLAVENTWSFAFLVIAVLLTLGTLGLLLRHRMAVGDLAERVAAAEAASERAAEVRFAARTGYEMDPRGEWILDELAEEGLSAPPAGGPPEKTAHWVKQAGVQIRNAELAARDGKWPEAISRYLQARAILPDLVDIDRRIGLAHLRLRDFEAAAPFFEADLERQPDSAPLWNNLGVSNMGQGRIERAEQDFLEALRRDPGYVPARYNIALLLFRSGRMEDAVEALDRVRTAYPDDTELLHMKALALIRLGRWEDSAKLLEESAERFPSVPPILFRLAEVRAHSGDLAGALEALQRAIRLVDARHAMVWITRREFDPLRDLPDFEAMALELSQAIR